MMVRRKPDGRPQAALHIPLISINFQQAQERFRRKLGIHTSLERVFRLLAVVQTRS